MSDQQRLRHNLAMIDRSRRLRRGQTPTERALWKALRNRQCGGRKFRRQEVIGRYIADFVCAEAMLVVELDGVTHETQVEYDADRTAWLAPEGYRVVRFTNQEVGENLEGVLEAILIACERREEPTP